MNSFSPNDARQSPPGSEAGAAPLNPTGGGPSAWGAAPPPIVNAPPSGMALLRALKRRWRPALIVSPLAALLVAASIWYFMPGGKHTARAVLELNPLPPNPVLRTTGQETSLSNFRQLQIALIRNQRIIGAALRDPKLAQLPTLREVDDPLVWLEQSLMFTAPGDAQVLEVKLQGHHAEDIRLLLNAIVKNYLTEFVNNDQTVRSARRDALQKLRNEYESEKRRTMAAKNQFVEKGAGNPNFAAVQMAFLRSDMERIKGKIGELESDIAKGEARIRMLGHRDPSRIPLDDRFFQEYFAQDAALRKLEDEWNEAAASVIDGQAKNYAPAIIARLRDKAANLERQVLGRKQELRPQAEVYWRQRASTELVKDAAEVNESLEFSRGLLEKYRRDFDRHTRMLEDLSRNQTRLDDSALDTESITEMLQMVERELRRLDAEVNAQSRVREIEEARVIPVDPAERKLRMAILGGGLTFLLVLAGLALWEFHGRRVESTDQIVYGLGLPLVGTVPAKPSRWFLGLAGGLNAEQSRQWQIAVQEAVATARTVLLNVARTSDRRMVMITSAMAGEGKTTLSTQLAISLAMAGHRTLLLDFDLRNPSAHKVVGMPHSPGWAEILRGELNVVDAIQTTTLDNLSFIPAGDCDSVALKALAQDELGQVLQWLRSQYDFVIVDTSPVLPVADALLLGRYMDGVIFSVLHEVSQIPKIYIATQRVAQLGIRTLGVVINGVREDKYGYGAYGDGYRRTAKNRAAETAIPPEVPAAPAKDSFTTTMPPAMVNANDSEGPAK